MFTLSEKQRVLNSPSEVRVFTATGVERTASANIGPADKLFVEGFGHFEISAITDIQLRRGRLAVNESKEFTVTVPAGLAIGDSIEIVVEMNTDRYQSELATVGRLGGVRPFVFTTLPLTAITAAAIRTAIVAAYSLAISNFPNGTFPFTVAAGTAAADVRLVTKSGYESVSFRRVQIRRSNQGIGTQRFVTLALNVTIALGFEGENLGKFLEESIRMGTPLNTALYGVDNASTQVDVRALYTSVSFTVSAPYLENLSTLAADHGPLPASHNFVLFLNEATSMALDSAASKLAAIALLRVAALTPLLTATAIAAPLTITQERAETLILATGASTTTGALFIA